MNSHPCASSAKYFTRVIGSACHGIWRDSSPLSGSSGPQWKLLKCSNSLFTGGASESRSDQQKYPVLSGSLMANELKAMYCSPDNICVNDLYDHCNEYMGKTIIMYVHYNEFNHPLLSTIACDYYNEFIILRKLLRKPNSLHIYCFIIYILKIAWYGPQTKIPCSIIQVRALEALAEAWWWPQKAKYKAADSTFAPVIV